MSCSGEQHMFWSWSFANIGLEFTAVCVEMCMIESSCCLNLLFVYQHLPPSLINVRSTEISMDIHPVEVYWGLKI